MIIHDDSATTSSSFTVDHTDAKMYGYEPQVVPPAVPAARPKKGRMRRRHSVDFKPTVEPEVKKFDPVEDENKSQYWYSKDEYHIIKARNSLIVKMMKTGHFQESDEHSFRGLEHKTRAGFKQRRANKFNALNAVLEEQDRQANMGVFEPEKIAKRYRRVSLNAAETAVVVASRDAEEAHEYAPPTPRPPTPPRSRPRAEGGYQHQRRSARATQYYQKHKEAEQPPSGAEEYEYGYYNHTPRTNTVAAVAQPSVEAAEEYGYGDYTHTSNNASTPAAEYYPKQEEPQQEQPPVEATQEYGYGDYNHTSNTSNPVATSTTEYYQKQEQPEPEQAPAETAQMMYGYAGYNHTSTNTSTRPAAAADHDTSSIEDSSTGSGAPETEQQHEMQRLQVRGLFAAASMMKASGGRMSRRSSM